MKAAAFRKTSQTILENLETWQPIIYTADGTDGVSVMAVRTGQPVAV